MRFRLLTALVSTLALLTPIAPASAGAAVAGDDLVERLTAIPGLSIVSQSEPDGHRFFVLTYRQPVDHRLPGQGTFTQRLTLLHRTSDAPVVLATGGYGLPATPRPSRTEPTVLLDANQVSVEHRFFTPSRPEPADWSDLTIWQEAADEHRIVQALKTIYDGRWIQTGASKGGMTSVYHRRFFPGDVDGVVAYVAPNDAVNPLDGAYDRFFATVGEQACRTALENVQREALRRRDRMVPLLEADAAANGYTFTGTLGTADRSFEMTVLDTAWAFWQYLTEADCALVPPSTATDAELYAWIDSVTFWGFYTDQGLAPYTPYYRQAATQLGWPDLSFRHLRGVARYPGLYAPNSTLPPALRAKHQALPMLDVDHWVRTRSERMMFVYGQNDPWSAERFVPSARDSHLYVAAGSNHGANISRLGAADAEAATATLRRWADVPASTPPAQARRSAVLPFDDMLPDRRHEPAITG